MCRQNVNGVVAHSLWSQPPAPSFVTEARVFKPSALKPAFKTRVQVSAEVQLDSMEVMDSDPDLPTIVA